ncbi:glycosyltransferase [Aliarcobacter cryaerophilus]|uniref:glycosyltransferase n=1 Tax=Aliarcobacter cryaerophilus TaxID=28198 RepID=UPI00112F6425|nr:glycosyltransferase [Aliarcobacter cryaerophilus]MCT7510735.1 glycosyltransferase [Aliarcobacter cryaerophilus]
MKILYIDIDIKYHAPTRNLIPLLLKKIADVDFYGLGYQSQELLDKGVESFIKENNKYDFIIVNEQVIWNSLNFKKRTNSEMMEAYKKNYSINFDISKIGNFLIEMFDFFMSYQGNKIVFLLETDYYNLKENQINILKDSNAFFITEGEQFIKYKKDLIDLKNETFYSHTNDNWANFVIEYNQKIISVSQFVGEDEFSFSNINDRKNIIEIPGTNYYNRKKAFKIIYKSEFSYSKKHYMKVYKILSKLGFYPYSQKILMKIYQWLFRDLINNTKYTYTCGSGLEWPIRKFYEIPALGSLLIATPCSGYKELGFEDKVNFILSKPENLIENINYLEKNPDLAQKIAKSGQDLIWKSHSLSARAYQIKQSLEAIIDNNFYGTYWEDGKFYIIYKIKEK